MFFADSPQRKPHYSTRATVNKMNVDTDPQSESFDSSSENEFRTKSISCDDSDDEQLENVRLLYFA